MKRNSQFVELGVAQPLVLRRIELGLTVNDIAARSGISVERVQLLECGSGGDPTFDTMRRLAQALDLSPSGLINLAEILAGRTVGI